MEVVCKLCGKKLKSFSGPHLRKIHGVTLSEYLVKFPYPDSVNLIECLLCGKKYNQIHWKHLRDAHGIKISEYREKFPDADIVSHATHLKFSEEMRRKLSSLNQNSSFVENKVRVGRELMGKLNSVSGFREAASVRMVIMNKTEESKIRSGDVFRELYKDLEFRKRMTGIHRETFRRVMKEKWRDPEFRKKALSRTSKEETDFFVFLDTNMPNKLWHCGGTFFITHPDGHTMSPDIKVHGSNKVIEYFGSFWHNEPGTSEEKRVGNMKESGFNCLVVWDYEYLNDSNDVLKKVQEFVSS